MNDINRMEFNTFHSLMSDVSGSDLLLLNNFPLQLIIKYRNDIS